MPVDYTLPFLRRPASPKAKGPLVATILHPLGVGCRIAPATSDLRSCLVGK